MAIEKALNLASDHMEGRMQLARLYLAGSKDRDLAGKRLKQSLAPSPIHPDAGVASVPIESLAAH